MSEQKQDGLVHVTTNVSQLAQRETAQTSAAATAKAIVEARFVVAQHQRRDWLQVRSDILEACKRSRFAEMAIFKVPRGGRTIEGPSIRFAEEAKRAMGNLDVERQAIYEDDNKKIVRVTVLDLERNNTEVSDVTVPKQIERTQLRPGQEAIGQRTNSQGKIVYLVRPSDGDLQMNEAAQCAKAERTLVLKILPSDIKEDCIDQCRETMTSKVKADPTAERKRIADAFAGINVKPAELKAYLGHDLDQCSPVELVELRQVYESIKQGETTWHAVTSKDEEETAAPAPSAEDQQNLYDDFASRIAQGSTPIELMAIKKELNQSKARLTAEMVKGLLASIEKKARQ